MGFLNNYQMPLITVNGFIISILGGFLVSSGSKIFYFLLGFETIVVSLISSLSASLISLCVGENQYRHRSIWILYRTNKGLALVKLGNYTGAMQYIDKALAIDPNYVYALIYKGLALVKLEEYLYGLVACGPDSFQCIECYRRIVCHFNFSYLHQGRDLVPECSTWHMVLRFRNSTSKVKKSPKENGRPSLRTKYSMCFLMASSSLLNLSSHIVILYYHKEGRKERFPDNKTGVEKKYQRAA